MKARFIRDDIEAMRGAPDRETERRIVRGRLRRVWKKGGVCSLPDAYMLVRMGVAVPADEECRLRANMTQKQMEAAQYAQDRLSRGIAFEDWEKYDKGEILGYHGDGSYIPGPNWREPEPTGPLADDLWED